VLLQVAPVVDELAQQAPIFSLEIVITADGSFAYSTDLDKFEPTLIAIFDAAVDKVQAIPQLDPSIMESLTYTTIPLLDSVYPMEAKVVMWRSKLSELVRHAVVAVRTYLALYDQYLPLLELDVADYLKQMEEAELGELMSSIDMHSNDLAQLTSAIPNSLKIGPFAVSCKKVGTQLLQHARGSTLGVRVQAGVLW
jgi:dynein heavy chain